MKLNPITSLNNIAKAPIFKGHACGPKLNYEIKDTVSFTTKNSSKIPTGANYDDLETINTSREKTIPKLKKAVQNGEDISSDRENLIYSRIKRVSSDVEKFISEHPEFSNDRDDITQDLIKIIIEKTEQNLNSNSDQDLFNQSYRSARINYFQKLVSSHKEEPAIIGDKDDLIDPVKIAEQNDLKTKISDILDKLPSNEATVLRMYYGLDGEEKKTVKEIADTFSTSLDKIRTLIDKGTKRLRHPQMYATISDYRKD